MSHLVVHSVGHDCSPLLLLSIAEGSDSQGNLQQTEQTLNVISLDMFGFMTSYIRK